MALKHPDTKEEWYALMAAYNPTWTRDKVDSSIRNYGYSQLEDTYNDMVRSIDQIFNKGIGQQLGMLVNSNNQKTATEDFIAQNTANWIKQNKVDLDNIANGTGGNKVYLERLVEAGIATPDVLDQYNSLIAGLQKYYPKITSSAFSSLGTKPPTPLTTAQQVELVAGMGTLPTVAEKSNNVKAYTGNDQEILAQILVDNGYPIIKSSNANSIKGSNSFAVIQSQNGRYQLSKPVRDYMQDPKIRALYNATQIELIKDPSYPNQSVSLYGEVMGNDGSIKTDYKVNISKESLQNGSAQNDISKYKIPIMGINTSDTGSFKNDLMANVDYMIRHNGSSTTAYNLPTAKSSPMELARYAIDNNIQNLQNYDWWRNNPNKDQAWKIIVGGTLKPSTMNVSEESKIISNQGQQGGQGGQQQPPQQDGQGNQAVQSNQSNQGSVSENINPVDQLVNMALLGGGSTANLQNQDWWSSSPVKGEAWTKIQDIMKSPYALAQYIVDNGIQNLQNYEWWNNNPYKQSAWNLVRSGTLKPTSGSVAEGSDVVPTDQSEGQQNVEVDTSQVGGGQQTPTDPEAAKRLEEALALIDADPNLPPELKSLYKQTVREWPADKVVDVQGILTEFNRIKTETIDPYYKSVVDFATDQISKSAAFQAAERNTQLEQERAAAGTTIRQAKAGLESAGMTFTGKGITTLGAESAYAQEPGQSAIPTQTPFGGLFYEGEIPQANRIMATSNALNYQKNIQALGAEAESRLGSGGAALLNLPGYGVTGGQMGSIEQNRQQQMGTTLSGLINQETANQNQANPLAYQPNLVSV